ncbi:SulP family inorganic anion transporter [Leucobacter insecticola]|uniref:SulP family inorganic anion transporter n=1 Tax=Leucobacter insecticola TaxID=2714934 RepID=A0A6G8FK31_9MICO|nr:SulP family inorganic anion transporter [Leucobacter insecticola]QIM16422.1 SulP family inorganic anion transporter [Leucobacter insecticola]
MSSAQPTSPEVASYRSDSSVLAVLRSPRLLTREALAGLVVGLALIPEAISFSIIAGVDPKVGLFSSFIMAVSIAFLGGRPAMITAATGAVALVVAPIAPRYGLDYLIATIILAGVFQVLFGLLGVAKLMRFIPRSVMVGFVNSLAILVFIAQLPHLIGVPWLVYPLVAAGILVIILMPRITKAIPAPLVSVIVITTAAVVFSLNVPTVGDQGELPRSLPELFMPQLPLTPETFAIIAPFAFAVAIVGLLESLLTAKLVDEITDTHSNKTRESWAQGVSNMLSGFFGGMGGCAVIGQTMMNVKVSGARSRVSTFLAGVFLLVLVVVLGDVVSVIPMAALVAVMIMVSIAAFDWHSIAPRTLRRMPKSETFVMVVTVLVVVLTHNLAIGVIVGVLVASVLFVRRVAHFVSVERTLSSAFGVESAHYVVTGELFFASSNDLTTLFSYAKDPERIVIDMSQAHLWDASTVASLDAIVTKYAQRDKTVEIVGMDEAATALHTRLSGDSPQPIEWAVFTAD